MDNYYTIKKFVERHENFLTEPALRNLIARSEPRKGAKGTTIPGNGLATAIVRQGRRIYVHEGRFMQWLESSSKETEANYA